MKPVKVTVEGERLEKQKALCDTIIQRAAVLMVEEVGATVPMMLDRLLTYAAVQACTLDGSPKTAVEFHRLADKIAGGVFHSVTGEGEENSKRH